MLRETRIVGNDFLLVKLERISLIIQATILKLDRELLNKFEKEVMSDKSVNDNYIMLFHDMKSFENKNVTLVYKDNVDLESTFVGLRISIRMFSDDLKNLYYGRLKKKKKNEFPIKPTKKITLEDPIERIEVGGNKLLVLLEKEGCSIKYNVIEQDESIRDSSLMQYQYRFTARNGVIIISENYPEISHDILYIRGSDKHYHASIYTYESKEDANEYYNKFIEAVEEFNTFYGWVKEDSMEEKENVKGKDKECETTKLICKCCGKPVINNNPSQQNSFEFTYTIHTSEFTKFTEYNNIKGNICPVCLLKILDVIWDQ